MTTPATFQAAFPYKDDVLALPVTDLDTASDWYSKHFEMSEIERRVNPPSVILERDGVKIGFAINGGDPEQEGAAVRVDSITKMRVELEACGVNVSDIQTDERNGEKFQAFFAVAPDGLCYYFNQLITD